MKAHGLRSLVLGITAALGLTAGATAGLSDVLMVTGAYDDSGERAVLLFDPVNGNLLNGNYISLGTSGVMKHAMQVGNEIWISEQAASVVHRYTLGGSYVGEINQAAPGQTLNNLRGMEVVGNTVYLANSGAFGGAPGPSLVTYDFDGNWQGTAAVGDSPFSILDYNGELLVGHQGTLDIQSHDYAGNNLGPFHTGSVSWVQQINTLANGNIIATGWSSDGLYEYDAAGNEISVITADAPRGVWELGNGNIMWTNGSGVHIFDVNLQTHHTVLGDFSGQYIDIVALPAPGALALLGAAGLAGTRRRRG